MSLDLLFSSIGTKMLHPFERPSLVGSLAATDASEAQLLPAQTYLEYIYGDASGSRAQTPMTVGAPFPFLVPHEGPQDQWKIFGLQCSPRPSSPKTIRLVQDASHDMAIQPQDQPARRRGTRKRLAKELQDHLQTPHVARRKMPQRPSALPQFPSVDDLVTTVETNVEYTIVISMFEVYNDRIFDLLVLPNNQKDLRRRALLFKPTEASPDRKVVAGLRKIVCGSYEEAMMVLETGLTERRIAGTGSNSVSSRSHGFFCLEVKKRPRGGMANSWTGANLTIVDLAGRNSFDIGVRKC